MQIRERFRVIKNNWLVGTFTTNNLARRAKKLDPIMQTRLHAYTVCNLFLQWQLLCCTGHGWLCLRRGRTISVLFNFCINYDNILPKCEEWWMLIQVPSTSTSNNQQCRGNEPGHKRFPFLHSIQNPRRVPPLEGTTTNKVGLNLITAGPLCTPPDGSLSSDDDFSSSPLPSSNVKKQQPH